MAISNAPSNPLFAFTLSVSCADSDKTPKHAAGFRPQIDAIRNRTTWINMHMNKSIVVLLSLVFFFATITASAQVTEAGYGSRLKLYAGTEGSMFQPDYAGRRVAEAGPQALYGVGGYVDADFTRWIQIEAEGRWLPFNQYKGNSESTYMIGPRVPIIEYKRFKPYGKFLIGIGGGNFLSGKVAGIAYGGGLEYRLSKKFTLRAFDFEYQNWYGGTSLKPYGGSAGISYRLF